MTDDDIRAAMALEGFRMLRGMAGKFGRTKQASTFIVSRGRRGKWLFTFGWSQEKEPSAKQRRDALIDADDPATGGCLLAMLGPCIVRHDHEGHHVTPLQVWDGGSLTMRQHAAVDPYLGRACIAVALSLGKWPGGVR